MSADDTHSDTITGPRLSTTTAVTQAGGSGAWPPGHDVTVIEADGDSPKHVHVVEPDNLDERPSRKVAIIGYTSSRGEAPYDDPSWEKWGMNNLHKQADIAAKLGTFSRWYNLHDLAELFKPEDQGGDAAHLGWLQQPHPFDVWAMDPLEGITHDIDGTEIKSYAERAGMPSLVAFPKAMLLQQFDPYFTNTVSWELAHLIYEAMLDQSYILSDVALYGIDMAIGSEYAAQRPSVEYFLGLLRGLGVELHIPESSDLLKCSEVYGGVDQHSGMRAKIEVRLRELTEQKAHVEQQMQQAQAIHASVCGAIDSFEYMRSVWLPPKASAGARDALVLPAGGVNSAVGQMLAEGEQRDRHSSKES